MRTVNVPGLSTSLTVAPFAHGVSVELFVRFDERPSHKGIDIETTLDVAQWDDERLVDVSDTLGPHVGQRELDANELGPDEAAWDELFDSRRARRKS